MSKPRYKWWSYVRNFLCDYPNKTSENESRAIKGALEETKSLLDGEDRLKVIDMVFFKKTHTLQGAALNVPCSYETAKRWQQQFIRCVARHFSCNGLL